MGPDGPESLAEAVLHANMDTLLPKLYEAAERILHVVGLAERTGILEVEALAVYGMLAEQLAREEIAETLQCDVEWRRRRSGTRGGRRGALFAAVGLVAVLGVTLALHFRGASSEDRDSVEDPEPIPADADAGAPRAPATGAPRRRTKPE